MSYLTSGEEVNHTCQLCGYQTLRKTHLKLHSQAVHEGWRFQCSGCEYQATIIKSFYMNQKSQCPEWEYQVTRPSQIEFFAWEPCVNNTMCLISGLVIYLNGYKRNQIEGSSLAYTALRFIALNINTSVIISGLMFLTCLLLKNSCT